MNKLELKNKVGEIANLISDGIKAWNAAGERLVELLDEGLTLDDIHAQMPPDVPLSVLEQFERIGRRQVLPSLLIAEFPAAAHLRKLSIDQQERLLSDGVILLLVRETETETLKCSVRDMTADQCKQVFDKCLVRSLSQQRAWLEGERARRSLSKIVGKQEFQEQYSVKSGKLIVKVPTEFTRRQLVMLLAEMES